MIIWSFVPCIQLVVHSPRQTFYQVLLTIRISFFRILSKFQRTPFEVILLISLSKISHVFLLFLFAYNITLTIHILLQGKWTSRVSIPCRILRNFFFFFLLQLILTRMTIQSYFHFIILFLSISVSIIKKCSWTKTF